MCLRTDKMIECKIEISCKRIEEWFSFVLFYPYIFYRTRIQEQNEIERRLNELINGLQHVPPSQPIACHL